MTGTLRPGRRAVRLLARLAWMGPAVFLLLLPVGPAAAQAGAAQPPGQSRVVQPAGVVRVGSLPPPRPGPQAPQAQTRRVPDAALIRSKKDEAQAHDGGPPAGPGALAPSAALKLAGGAGFAGVAYADQPVGYVPPDTQVAAGPAQLFEMVNLQGLILDKASGAVQKRVDLHDFFIMPPDSTTLSDPRIRFDSLSGRWFVVALSASPTGGTWLMAVSKSGDPLGQFVTYWLPTPGSFPDFPAIGLNDDKVVVTGNAFCPDGSGCGYLGTEFAVFNKAQMMAGGDVGYFYYPPDNGTFSLRPAFSLSPTAALYVAGADVGTPNKIRLWTITGTPGGSGPYDIRSQDLPIASFGVPPDARQLGTNVTLDTGDNRLLDGVYRNGSFWVSANTSCDPKGDRGGRACLQLIEIKTASLSIGQNFSFGLKNIYHYYPAIQLDSSNNLLAVFSRSSTTEYASVYAGGRLATDAPNTLAQGPLLLKQGQAAYQPFADRWGDYSGAGLDPSDPTRAWVAGEYAGQAGGSAWGTWIAPIGFR